MAGPIDKAKMFQMLEQFAESLSEDGGEGDMASGDYAGEKPAGEVEISVEAQPEGMGGEKPCPTCGHPM